ncbi:hypothetical protein, partial [Frankia sp. EI5c]|uniref:DNA polymerase III subunit beta family protein n=1 Tax=Frankia sp. EI5c TaxID=683316 RepID=UPI0037BF1D65
MSASAAPLLDGGLVVHAARGQLADALALVAHAIPTSTYRRHLSGVLLTGEDDGTFIVSAYDDTLALSVRLPDVALAPGRLVCDHRELTRLLRAVATGDKRRDAAALPVTLEGADPATPTLSAAGFTVPVTASHPADYPPLPSPPPARLAVDGGALSAALARVTPALGRDDLLPILTGVNLRHEPGGLLRLATTDRYRLAVAAIGTVGDLDAPLPEVTIPGTVHKIAARWVGGQVRIGVGLSAAGGAQPDLVSLIGGDLTVVARTISGTFPSYQRLLPQETACTVVVDRARLHAQVRRVAALLTARTTQTWATVTVHPGAIVVAPWFSDRPEQVTAPEIPAEVTGLHPPGHRVFKPSYLLDAIDSFTSPTITLYLPADVAKPVLLTATPDELADPAVFR